MNNIISSTGNPNTSHTFQNGTNFPPQPNFSNEAHVIYNFLPQTSSSDSLNLIQRTASAAGLNELRTSNPSTASAPLSQSSATASSLPLSFFSRMPPHSGIFVSLSPTNSRANTLAPFNPQPNRRSFQKNAITLLEPLAPSEAIYTTTLQLGNIQNVEAVAQSIIYEKQKKRGRKKMDKSNLICQSCLEIKTPLWRRGPNGINTLCNACGLLFSKDKTIYLDSKYKI